MAEAGEGESGLLRLVLVGKSGGGRSATGNTLLGREEFDSRLQAAATTRQCQVEQGNWNGQPISVVDTPDILGSGASVEAQIQRCLELSRPGPHALLFVTQVGRFTAEDREAARRVQELFGTEARRYMIVLFTCKEDLGGTSLEDYVAQSGNEALQRLLAECGSRICAFNNRAEGAEREAQVSRLMGLVQQVVRENGGGCCSSRSATRRAPGSACSVSPLSVAAGLVRLLLAGIVLLIAISRALWRLLVVLSCLKKWAADTFSRLHHKCFLPFPIPFFKKPTGAIPGNGRTDQ